MANVELINAKRKVAMFNVPAGAVKIASKVDNSVAYTYDNAKGLPTVIAFFGNQTKRSFWFHYNTPAQRAAKLTEFFESVTANQERKAAMSAERKQPHTLKVGDILNTSWGYDQTQVEFYQVVEVKGKATVVTRELCQEVEEGSEGYDSNRVLAIKDKFCTKATSTHRVNMSGGYPSISANYGQNATLWDGNSQHHSWGR